MTTYRLLQYLLYAYYVIWAALAVGFVLGMLSFTQTRRPRTLSEAMVVLCALLFFLTIGRYAFGAQYLRDNIESRFALAALAVALVVHFFVAALEMVYQWRILRKHE